MPSLFDARDWRAVEDVLNQASATAGEPFYSQVERAKSALLRLASAAQDHAPHVRRPPDGCSCPAGSYNPGNVHEPYCDLSEPKSDV